MRPDDHAGGKLSKDKTNQESQQQWDHRDRGHQEDQDFEQNLWTMHRRAFGLPVIGARVPIGRI